MHVGVCRVTLLASHCHSLKEKRVVVRKLKDRVRTRFYVSLAEVGGLDTWQRLVLGFSVVSNDRVKVEGLLAEICRFIESCGVADLVSVDREILAYGDSPFGEAPLPIRGSNSTEPSADEDWIPESWKLDSEMS